MGDQASRRAAEPAEIEAMADLVREAVAAGAAGFATSFAITHLGADGQPIPSRWADRAEIAALCKASADGGRSVIGINGASEGMRFADMYDLQLEVGIPFTYTAVLTSQHGRAPQGGAAAPRGAGQGRRGVAAGVVPPADVLDEPDRAVHLEHQPDLRRADARHPRRAAGHLHRSGVARAGAAGVEGRPRPGPALGHLRDHGVQRATRS